MKLDVGLPPSESPCIIYGWCKTGRSDTDPVSHIAGEKQL